MPDNLFKKRWREKGTQVTSGTGRRHVYMYEYDSNFFFFSFFSIQLLVVLNPFPSDQDPPSVTGIWLGPFFSSTLCVTTETQKEAKRRKANKTATATATATDEGVSKRCKVLFARDRLGALSLLLLNRRKQKPKEKRKKKEREEGRKLAVFRGTCYSRGLLVHWKGEKRRRGQPTAAGLEKGETEREGGRGKFGDNRENPSETMDWL